MRELLRPSISLTMKTKSSIHNSEGILDIFVEEVLGSGVKITQRNHKKVVRIKRERQRKRTALKRPSMH